MDRRNDLQASRPTTIPARRKRWVAVAVSLAVLLAGTSCSDDDGDGVVPPGGMEREDGDGGSLGGDGGSDRESGGGSSGGR